MIIAAILQHILGSPEPLFWLRNLEIVLYCFLAYFFGVIIRKTALPSAGSLPLSHQLLLGVPVSLIVVPPIIFSAQNTTELAPFLISLGVIMEQGMLLNETVTKHLHELRNRI